MIKTIEFLLSIGLQFFVWRFVVTYFLFKKNTARFRHTGKAYIPVIILFSILVTVAVYYSYIPVLYPLISLAILSHYCAFWWYNCKVLLDKQREKPVTLKDDASGEFVFYCSCHQPNPQGEVSTAQWIEVCAIILIVIPYMCVYIPYSFFTTRGL